MNRNILIEEITNLATHIIMEKHSKKKKNNKQEEYIKRHGAKEQNAMRGMVSKIANSDGANNAAIARQIKKDHPNIKIDSSRITKMTKNKPGYSGGRFHWDREKANAYLQAADELGIS